MRETLDLWRRDETAFREKLKAAVLTFSGEGDTCPHGKVINEVMKWLRESLEGKNNDAKYELEISGSVGENTKIVPMNELDIVLRVWLEVDVEVKSQKSEDFDKIREELSRSVGKQPAKHLVRIILRKAYPHLGQVGDELPPDRFGKVMDVFISHLLKDSPLPSWLRRPTMVTAAPDLVERTKAGVMLNLEYLDDEEEWRELSVDIVPVLVLSKEQREKYLQVIISISQLYMQQSLPLKED